MDRKILTVSILCLAVVLISGSILGVIDAANGGAQNKKDDVANPDLYISRPEAEQKKEVTLGKEKIELEYEKTRNEPETQFDIYHNENEDEYAFNEEGQLLVYQPKEKEPASEVKITEAQAKAIAEKEVLQLFPEQMKTFKFESCSGGSYWYIDYAELMGKDGFIQGEDIQVMLDPYGAVLYCDYDRRPELDSFDRSRLADLDQETMDQWVLEKGKKRFGEETTLKSARYILRENEGEIVLMISARFDGDLNYGEYIYPLETKADQASQTA